MNGTELIAALSAEVERITTSTYPVALQTLHSILSLDVDGSSLYIYASAKPCKIQKLASEVLAALETWPYVLEVLVQLSFSAKFRHAVLIQKPGLLHDILNKVLKSPDVDGQYSTLCMLFLSEPLPKSVQLPDSAQDFFVHSVEEAIASSSSSALWRVYDLLVGTCQSLPRILSAKLQKALEEKLSRVIRSSRTWEDQRLVHTCFGIIYALDVQDSVESSTFATEIHQQVQFKCEVAREFFCASKTYKTLNLIALQVSLCCRSSVGVSQNEISKNIEIAVNIFRAVDRKILEEWCKSADGKTNIGRILKHFHEPGLDLKISLMLGAIIASLSEIYSLPQESIDKVERIIHRARSISQPNWRDLKSLDLIFAAFSHHLSDKIVAALVFDALKAAAPTTSMISLPEYDVLGHLLRLLTTCAPRHGTLPKQIMFAFVAIQDEPLMHVFLTETPRRIMCGCGDRCDATLSEARREIGSLFATLYLQAHLIAEQMEMGSGSLQTFALRVLEKSHNLAALSLECKNNTPFVRPSPQWIEASATPELAQTSHNWKEKLADHVRIEAQYRETSMLRLFGEMCGDLERRCLNIEEPLRQAQAMNMTLQNENEILQKKAKDQENELLERDLILESLEAEKTETDDYLTAAQEENQALLDRVDSLEKSLRDANEAAQTEVTQLRTSADSRELELRAASASKESVIQDQKRKLEESEQSMESLGREMQSAILLQTALEGQLCCLRNELKSCQQILQSEKAAVIKIGAENITVKDVNEHLTKELKLSQEKLQESVSQLQKQRVAHESDLQKAKDQVDSLTSLHESALEKMSITANDRTAIHLSELSDARECVEVARRENAKLNRTTEHNNAVMIEQQRKIDALEDLVAQKDDEISDFLAMRQTLAAAIGTKPSNRKHARKSVHYDLTPEHVMQSPINRKQSRRTTGVPKETAVQVDEYVDRSFGSASSKGGRTPKRARPRQSPRVSAFRQQHSSIAATKIAQTSNERIPLRDVSAGRVNFSAMKSHGMKKDMHGRQDILEGDDENVAADFEFGSDIFTSTPFTPKGPVGGMEDFADTTMDE